MTDFFKDKITIYISIPATPIKARHFNRRIVDKCQMQGGFVDKTDGTVRNIVNAKTVITKDFTRYVPPETFYNTPEDLRTDIFTVQVGDFVVFGEVDDVIENAEQFANIQQKYKNNGIKVTSVNAFINGMAVDNITITNA